MRKHIQIPLFILLFWVLISCQPRKELRVMQFNIWQEGTQVENGFQGIVDNIISLNPDLVTFSEVRNYNGVSFIPRLLSALEQRGVHYYGKESVSTGIISKYEIESHDIVYPLDNDRGSVIKDIIKVGKGGVALYSAHLDWLNCSSYLPRGYDGCTWEKLPSPISDVDSILFDNRQSFRDDEIKAIIRDAKKEINLGRAVIIGGDFNEPSHLDWQDDTKDMRGHNGLVIDWDCSTLLANEGYVDTFREKHPDAVRYPGFTFPANNEYADLKKLCWSPDADDRERIDFIYYKPNRSLSLKNVSIIGPSGCIFYGKRTDKDSDGDDSFIQPSGTWPTDHKALMADFSIK